MTTRRLHPPRTSRAGRKRIGTQGFAYLALLILMGIVSVVAAAGVSLGAIAQRRTVEEELLAVGAAYQDALIRYADATPRGQSRYPRSLADLLKDPRYPNPVRHLRKPFADPLTGSDVWGLVQLAGDGGIVGVFSLSDAKPIKIGNFDPEFQGFEGKTSYRDWKFTISIAPPTGQFQTPK